jgi:NAD(P)-dependent dehydrogenase (short-subunit alcohol dehydrogenase family)
VSNVALVTGASSGIGRATALELLRAGYTVYGTARNVESLDALQEAGGNTLAMDVTKEPEVEHAVETIVDAQGRIDVLVNNAGYGLYGAAEDVPIEDARYQFEVNLFGPARLTQLVLPCMRAQHSGTIVNVSSMGGQITFPLGAWYHASKHALEAYSDALRMEVAPFGIHVVIIQPGLIKTEFGGVSSRAVRKYSGNGPYGALAESFARSTERTYEEQGRSSDPSVVAKVIRKAVESKRPKARYAVGRMARPLMALDALLPDSAFDRIMTRAVK